MIRFSNFHYNREPSYFFIFLSQMYYTLTIPLFFTRYMCLIFHNLLYYKCYFPYTGNRKGVLIIGYGHQLYHFCRGRYSQQLYLQVAKQKETK